MTADDRGWHSGPWKPSFQFDEQTPNRAIVFFDGLYRTNDPGPFPFAFTLGCFNVESTVKRSSPDCRTVSGSSAITGQCSSERLVGSRVKLYSFFVRI